MLLEYGADVNATTEDGWTALMGAADNGHTCIVSFSLPLLVCFSLPLLVCFSLPLLVFHNQRMKERSHTTPLSALQVQLLLSHNANVHAVRRNGETAYIVAKDGGHTEVLRLLQDKLHKETTLESGSS